MSTLLSHVVAADFPPNLRAFGTTMTGVAWAGCFFVLALAARDVRYAIRRR